MTQLSADCDLNVDPNTLFNNDGLWVGSDSPGIPQNGPESLSGGWAVRGFFFNTGIGPGNKWPGYMVFESSRGVWTRHFHREYSDGSTSYSTWVRVSNFCDTLS